MQNELPYRSYSQYLKERYGEKAAEDEDRHREGIDNRSKGEAFSSKSALGQWKSHVRSVRPEGTENHDGTDTAFETANADNGN